MSDLDAKVRAADPDRWMSSRFVADDQARADLIALYAFEAELTAIPSKVSQPLLAEMRYAWWREQLDGVFAGTPRKGHPVLEALAGAVERGGLDRKGFETVIEGHIGRVHGEPHNLEGLFVAPMRAAARLLGGPGAEDAAAPAGRLWGLAVTGQTGAAQAFLPEANQALRALPAKAFPAVAHAALRDLTAPEPVKRLRLTWAVLRGRI